MKKVFSIIVLMTCFLLMQSSKKYHHPNKNLSYSKGGKFRVGSNGEARWTGTVTFLMIVNISNAAMTSKSERHIKASFVNALPTMYRNDPTTNLDFTDDKGPGTHTFHAEGKMIGGQTCITDCSSSGKAELHAVVINESENVYDIEVISPECKGTTCGENGGTTEYGPESQSYGVSDQPLNGNKDVLSGSKTTTSDVPGGGTATTTVTWNLVRVKEMDVELIVKPTDYDSWLPEPGKDQRTAGTVMDVSLKLQGKNGATTTKKAKAFELHLINTSREPGMTINYPVNSQDKSADLKFIPQAGDFIGDSANQEMKIICTPSRQTGNFKIGSYDGGGWTTLTATAILDDDTHVEGHLLVSTGDIKIPIPKSTKSVIGEYWLTKNGNPNETDDNETSAGNPNKGDGLTAYEEYRGVISRGKFKRLDPGKKELGIKVKKSEFSLFAEGIGWFKNASGIDTVIFYENEIGPFRTLNNNFSHAHDFDQDVLFLIKGPMPDLVGGKAYTTTENPAIPTETIKVVVDVDQIHTSIYQFLIQMFGPLSYSSTDLISATVAHELSHGVSVAHHGEEKDPFPPSSETVTTDAKFAKYQIFDKNGHIISARPFNLFGAIGGQNNEGSGDLSCFMAYNPYFKWAFHRENGFDFFYEVPVIPIGKNMCNSRVGTGINAPSPNVNVVNKYFGKATNGNCISQIKLR